MFGTTYLCHILSLLCIRDRFEFKTCSQASVMNNGDFVRIDYVGRLETGEIFDLTKEDLAKKEKVYNKNIKYRPIPIIIGKGFVIPGLDKALMDMNVGDKKGIEVSPEDGFGQRDPKLIRVLPKKVFKDFEPRQGLVVDFGGMKGRIQSVTGNRIRVDFNNPLAGKKLLYEIAITEKIADPSEQIKASMEFFGIDNVEVKIEDNSASISCIALPKEIKDRLSKIILDNVKINDKNLEKIQFIETYQRKEDKSDELKK